MRVLIYERYQREVRQREAGQHQCRAEGPVIITPEQVGERYRAQGTTPDQPDIWTTLDFEADQAAARELAHAFADVLDQPGWYVDFHSPTESFVVFPGRIYRYPRGDQAGRADAQAYGRQLAIPEPQLDWTE
jgi:hypothetical protein